MFNNELKRQVRSQYHEIRDLKEKYWQLEVKYNRLLKHLNLKEVTVPTKTIYEERE